VSDNLKCIAPKAKARRRLIRGAFAAPAALTLCSGSAIAATSSSLRALNNQLLNAETRADPTPGSWIRVQVYSSTPGSGGGNAIYVVNAVHVRCFGIVSANFLPSTAAWATVSDSKPYYPDVNRRQEFAIPTQYVALRFDGNGEIIGVSNGTTGIGGTAVTRSAWTSFGPAGTCN
jgi:hypothetical protein